MTPGDSEMEHFYTQVILLSNLIASWIMIKLQSSELNISPSLSACVSLVPVYSYLQATHSNTSYNAHIQLLVVTDSILYS